MKKFLLLFSIAAITTGVACKNETSGPSEKTKKNLQVNAAIMKDYSAGDFSKMNEYMTENCIDHGGEKGDVVGRDSVISQMKYYHEMMPDMKVETVKELADDDYVFSWTKSTGTMNGKMTTMTSMDITKFADGKAVEHWVMMDPREMMAMMAPPAVDSSAVK